MPTLTKANRDVTECLHTVMEKYHQQLVDSGVTVGVLMATASESAPEAPPVSLHGYPCYAVVKVTPYRQRVQGIEDAVITVDSVAWNRLNADERAALIDHELTHLEPAVDSEGAIKCDDQGRPKLKVRLHDWQLGGFASIAARHKSSAIEAQAFRQAHADFYQQVFAWGDDAAGAATPADGPEVTVSSGTTSVSFSGADFEKIGRVGKALRAAGKA